MYLYVNDVPTAVCCLVVSAASYICDMIFFFFFAWASRYLNFVCAVPAEKRFLCLPSAGREARQ